MGVTTAAASGRREAPPAAPRHRRSSPERRRRAVARRRRRLRGLLRLAVLVAVIVVAVWASVRVADAAAPDSQSTQRVYVVRQGDTLWSIATGLYDVDRDPRAVVWSIQHENHLHGVGLTPGQILVLPPAESL